jgi:hypothetical protein
MDTGDAGSRELAGLPLDQVELARQHAALREEMMQVIEHGDEASMRRVLERARIIQKQMLAYLPPGTQVRVPRFKPKKKFKARAKNVLKVARNNPAVAGPGFNPESVQSMMRRHSLVELVHHEMGVLSKIAHACTHHAETKLATQVTQVLRHLADEPAEKVFALKLTWPLPDFLPQYAKTEEEAARRREAIFSRPTGPFDITPL